MVEYIEAEPGYEPGVCNIGAAEIRRRQRIGVLGLAGAVGLGILLVAAGAPRPARLLVAAPMAIALSGFMQARCKFCTGYAMAGLQNMGELGQAQVVEDAEAQAADRRRALMMQGVAIIGGLLGAVAFWRSRV